MERLICKHFYSDLKNDVFSETYYDIFDDYSDLSNFVVRLYSEFYKDSPFPYDESNIQIYRCGSISNLGEFRIYSTPLPIYLKDIKEALKK